LPSAVRGPVECWALAWLARRRGMVDIGESFLARTVAAEEDGLRNRIG
jgi:hypothetical protein